MAMANPSLRPHHQTLKEAIVQPVQTPVRPHKLPPQVPNLIGRFPSSVADQGAKTRSRGLQMVGKVTFVPMNVWQVSVERFTLPGPPLLEVHHPMDLQLDLHIRLDPQLDLLRTIPSNNPPQLWSNKAQSNNSGLQWTSSQKTTCTTVYSS